MTKAFQINELNCNNLRAQHWGHCCAGWAVTSTAISCLDYPSGNPVNKRFCLFCRVIPSSLNCLLYISVLFPKKSIGRFVSKRQVWVDNVVFIQYLVLINVAGSLANLYSLYIFFFFNLYVFNRQPRTCQMSNPCTLQ